MRACSPRRLLRTRSPPGRSAGLAALHSAGALKHHVVDRDGALTRMLPKGFSNPQIVGRGRYFEAPGTNDGRSKKCDVDSCIGRLQRQWRIRMTPGTVLDHSMRAPTAPRGRGWGLDASPAQVRSRRTRRVTRFVWAKFALIAALLFAFSAANAGAEAALVVTGRFGVRFWIACFQCLGAMPETSAWTFNLRFSLPLDI